MTGFGRNFLPGPTGVHPDVLAALTAPMFAHYWPQMRPYLDEIQPSLQAMFGTTRPVFAVTCSGTGMMEMAIRNSVRRRVLVVVSGFFGEYFARIAEQCDKEVIRVSVPFGHTLEADQLEALFDGPPVDAVALVHSESSTGALAPLEELAAVVQRQQDVLLLVDAISSAAAVPLEVDRIGVDFMITGSQKALSLPPGLAFGAVSPRLEERARKITDAGHYFSVTRWLKMTRDRLLFETPALSIYMGLLCQIRRVAQAGGWPARWARQEALAKRMWSWLETRPELTPIAPQGRRSPTVTALDLGAGREARGLVEAMAERGYLITWAVDSAARPSVFRIGHMGDTEVGHLESMLAELEPLLPR
jgi:aspartate aminotransferase-like enzyme